MSRFLILLCFSFSFLTNTSAQTGYWEGSITQDGKRHPITIYIAKENKKKLIGTSSILIEKDIIGLEIYGVLHGDRSISLWDTQINDSILPEGTETFYRRYQMIYHKSYMGDKMEGYWQEVSPHPLDSYKRGFIELKRSNKKPKA